jgi:WD40 repeat protein
LESDPALGTMLCVEATRLSGTGRDRPVPQAEEALRQVVQRVSGYPVLGERYHIRDLCISPNGRWALGYDLRSWMFDREDPNALPKRVGLSVTASPDGRWAIVYDSKQKVSKLLSMEDEDPEATARVLPKGPTNDNEYTFFIGGEHLVGVAPLDESSKQQVFGVWGIHREAPVEKLYEYEQLGDGKYQAAFSGDASWVAVWNAKPADEVNADPQFSVYLWDLKTLGPTSKPQEIACDGQITDVELSSTARWLRVSSDVTHQLWRLSDSTGEWTEGPEFLASGSMAISPDESWLATTVSRGAVHLHNLTASNRPIVLGGGDSAYRAVEFSADNKWLAATSGHFVTLWSLPHPRQLLHIPGSLKQGKGRVSRSGEHLETWFGHGSQCRTRTWDLGTGVEIGAVRHEKGSTIVKASKVAMSDDGRLRACFVHDDRQWAVVVEDLAKSPDVVLWEDKSTGKSSNDRPYIRDLEFSSDGSSLLVRTSSRSARKPGEIVVYSTSTGEKLCNIPVPANSCSRAHLSPDGDHVLIYQESKLLLHRISDTSSVREREYSAGTVMAVSPNGLVVLTLSSDGTFRLNDLGSETVRGKYALPEEMPAHACKAIFRDDAQRVALGYRHWIVVLRTSDMKVVDRFETTEDDATPLAFLDENRLLVDYGTESVVWEIEPGAPVHCDPKIDVVRFGPHEKPVDLFRFSNDASWLVSAASRELCLWDLTISKPANTRRRLLGHTGEITALRFSADGKWLLTGTGTPIRPGMVSYSYGPFLIQREDGSLDYRAVRRPGDGEMRLWRVEPPEWNGIDTLDHNIRSYCPQKRLGNHHTVHAGRWVVAARGYSHNASGSVPLGIVAWDVTDSKVPKYVLQLHTLAAPDSMRKTLISVQDRRVRDTRACRVSPRGEWVGFAGDGAATLLQIGKQDAKPIKLEVGDAKIELVAFAADDSVFATSGADGLVRVFSLSDNGEIGQPEKYRLPEAIDGGQLTDLKVSYNGKGFLARNRKTLVLYQRMSSSGDVVPATISANEIDDVCFSPDGKWLLTSTFDKEFVVSATIGPDVGKPVGRHRCVSRIPKGGIRFSPDGKQLLVCYDSHLELTVWSEWEALLDSARPGERIDLSPPSGEILRLGSGALRFVSFSPCSRFLATLEKVGDTHTVTRWQLDGKTPESVALWRTKLPLRSVGVSTDGMQVSVAADHNGGWEFFAIDASVERLLEVAIHRAGTPLRLPDRERFEIKPYSQPAKE